MTHERPDLHLVPAGHSRIIICAKHAQAGEFGPQCVCCQLEAALVPKQMPPWAALLLECRDALPAITLARAKLYNVDLTLADRIEAALKPWELPKPPEGPT